MNDWTAGYIADINYTFGYYQELNPLWNKLAFLYGGYMPPEINTACELGFGQGMSINFHAAASACSWYGTDFNPSHACYAQNLAAVSGADVKLYDESFLDFCSRQDLPDFDYIGLHGIWSWVSGENRAIIVDFIRRKLRVGGVVYISYNTLPGWSTFAPVRHLMTEHANTIGVEGHGIVSRVDGALDFMEKLLLTNPDYTKLNPLIADRLKSIKQQNRHYLAHEYFNHDWQPMHFATLAECLEPAKLTYVCSGNYLEQVNILNLNPEQLSFLNDIADPIFRESVRDFIVNQQFRRDFWVKGGLKLSNLERTDALKALRVVLVTHKKSIRYKIRGRLGDSVMNEAIYDPIIDLLADHTPKTLGELETELSKANMSFGQLLEAIMILISAGYLAVAQEASVINQAKQHTDKLNSHLINKSRGSNDITYLASPVTGGGFSVGLNQQLFLLSTQQGGSSAVELAQSVWQILASQGRRLIHQGNVLESAEENIAELTSQAAEFLEYQLPILKALYIV
ncbi:class I SAM-dependent methyltransferase [Methylobacter sp.]|uniref:class I SAM-dependent methyltransferase n=1 Tax=Methylobacter sp. TaxID=2051955 RepID=UPI002FDD99C6